MKKQTLAHGAAVIAAAALLAGPGLAGAPSSAVSLVELTLDTRTLSAAVLAEETGVDARSFTVDLSDEILLNTKIPLGTMILLR
jgi:hypothetical protein